MQSTSTPLGTTHYAQNALGNTVVMTDTAGRVTRSGYDGTGTLRWQQRHDGQLTIYHVDGMGRVTTTIQNYQNGMVDSGEPADQDIIMPTRYDAAGRQVLTTDAGRRATAYTYTLLDQLASVTENAASGSCATAPCNATTRYQYDRMGNRTAMIDALDRVRRFTYDAAGRQLTATDAANVTTAWSYDKLGRKTLQDDPRGASYDLTFAYDELDRITQTLALNLSTPVQAQYDALGRRIQLTNASGSTTFTYNPLGYLTTVGRAAGTVGYAYSSRGERTQLRYPDGASIDYQYDGVGRLQQVKDTTDTLATYGYDPAGRLDTLTRANGATTAYTYDAADRQVRQTTHTGTDLLSDFHYQLDARGQRTVVTETLPLLPEPAGMQSLDSMQSFAADALDQNGAFSLNRMASSTTAFADEQYLAPAADGQSMLATTSIYTATLSDQGVDLTLRGTSGPAADRSLAVRVQQLKRGTTTIPLAASRPVRDPHNPNGVGIRRAAGIREEQIAYADGVKQNIILDQPLAGSGNLEIRYHLTTRLEAQVTADQGLRFFRKSPGNMRQRTNLTMSPVVVYDAAGTQMTARVVLQGQQLVATIPDAFLTQAQYPLTIDPLIGTATTLSHGTSNPMPTAIGWWYLGYYLAVFSDARESATPRVYAQAFSANGDLAGEPLRVSTTSGTHPTISPVLTATYRSLVVWQAPASGGHDIVGRRMGMNQSLGNPFSITTGITDDIRPQVTSNPTAQEYLVVWSDGTDGAVRAQRVSATGSLTGTAVTVFGTGTWDTNVQVTFNPAQQEYLVVAATSTGIIAQRLSATGSLISTPITVTTLGSTPTRLLLAYASTPNQYLVAWDTASGISGRLVSATGTLPGSVLTLANTSTTSLDPGQLVWNSTRQEYLLSWTRTTTGTVEAQVLTSSAVTSGSAWTLATSTSAMVDTVRVALDPGWQRYGVIWHETSGEQRRIRGATVTAATGALAVGPLTIVDPRSTAEQAIIAYNSLDDSHLVVWRDVVGATTATLRLQRVAGDGTLQGPNWTLPLTMSVRASAPTLAFSPEGQSYLLAWQDDATDGTRMIRGARISRTGQLLDTTPITITAAGGHRITPHLAYNPDQQEYLVVWTTIHPDGHRSTDGQRVGTSGTLVGSAIQAHSPTGTAPRIVYHPDQQEYLVVWMNPAIHGRRLQGDGTPIGTVHALNTSVARPCCGSVRLAVLPDTDEYLMVWGEHNRNTSGMHSTWARRIGADGTPSGPEIAVQGEVASTWQTGQAVVTDPVHQEYLVLWAQNNVIYGQRLDQAGALEGGRITLASPPNVKLDPTGIARGTTGESYLIWRSAEQSYGYGIVGQRYASPQASFTATAVAPIGTMAFSDTSTSPLAITSWLWTFSDGITSTLQHPTHVYSPTGLYTVTLTITSGTEWDLGTQLITVPNTLPTPLQTTVITYTYDGLSRLTESERSSGEVYTYTYDLVGNRLSAWEEGVGRSWSYTAADQVVGWTYDAAGNLTQDGTQTYTYNALNHMTGATPTGGLTTTYQYNGDGVLLAQTTGTTSTSFTQDLQAPLSQMLAVDDGTTTTQYIYGYERLAEKASSAQTWPIHDALGSVRATLDSTGLPLTASTYDPWGQPSGGAQPSPFGFTGEYQNQGLVYLRARWYQPGTGRFTGRDPFAGWSETPYSLHAYQYGYSDPVNNIDPTGKWACSIYSTNSPLYYTFCQKVTELLEAAPKFSHRARQTDALGVLIYLFRNEGLPGGSVARGEGFIDDDLTPAQERLDYVLWLTEETQQSHFGYDFNDSGFAKELQDGQLFEKNYSDNQVGHFLTGVRFPYSPIAGNFNDKSCVIGHEKIGDGGPLTIAEQCWIGQTRRDHGLFDLAISFDRAGAYSDRDCALSDIVPGLPDVPAHNPRWGASSGRLGNSHQDLRLSVKGWIFGEDIRDGSITTLTQASTWLSTNLR